MQEAIIKSYLETCPGLGELEAAATLEALLKHRLQQMGGYAQLGAMMQEPYQAALSSFGKGDIETGVRRLLRSGQAAACYLCFAALNELPIPDVKAGRTAFIQALMGPKFQHLREELRQCVVDRGWEITQDQVDRMWLNAAEQDGRYYESVVNLSAFGLHPSQAAIDKLVTIDHKPVHADERATVTRILLELSAPEAQGPAPRIGL